MKGMFSICLIFVLLISFSNSRNFKLALWHEDVSETAKHDPENMKNYLTALANFVKFRKIDRVMVHLQNPQVFTGYTIDNYVHFLSLLPNTEVGVEFYINPQYGIWTYNNSVPGGLKCGNKDYAIKPPAGGCKKTVAPFENVACPNNLEQMFLYVEAINKAAAKAGLKNKVIAAGVDGEGGGAYTGDKEGFCQVKMAAKKYAPSTNIGNSLDVGKAHSAGASPEEVETHAAYPELYWMYDNKGFVDVDPKDPINSAYKKFANNPVGLLNYLAPLYDRSKQAWTKGTWPMFSTESLEVKNCVRRFWGVESDHCGVFNGFGSWTWENFEKFMELFAEKYKMDRLAIYEWQFIPTSWLSTLNFLE